LLSLSALIPLLTITENSVQVNGSVAIVNFIIYLFFVRNSFYDLKLFFSGGLGVVASFFLISFIVLIFSSFIFVGGYDGAFYYLSFLLLFYSLFKFFKAYPDLFFVMVWVKIFSVVVCSFVFLWFALENGSDFYKGVVNEPPVYRHLRHFNYDLMLAIGGVAFLYSEGRIRLKFFLLICFVLFFFSIWSGGRGQLVSVFVFMALLLVSGMSRISINMFCALAFSLLMVYVSGESHL